MFGGFQPGAFQPAYQQVVQALVGDDVGSIIFTWDDLRRRKLVPERKPFKLYDPALEEEDLLLVIAAFTIMRENEE